MKKLILVRHAKSDWGHDGLKDIDRPINQRGYNDAYDMSNWFGEHHDKPDMIVTSDATRALSTALIFSRLFEFGAAKVLMVPEIYESDVKTLKACIAALDNKANSVMLFGHNPGLTNLANELCADMDFDNIPTTGMVAIQFDVKAWKDVVNTQGKTIFYRYPKEFK